MYHETFYCFGGLLHCELYTPVEQATVELVNVGTVIFDVACCKAAGVDFRTWMIYFLDHVHDYDQDYNKDIAELLPDNLKAKRDYFEIHENNRIIDINDISEILEMIL